jgi:hypothetical protein
MMAAVQSTVELASMAPGTMLCDYSLYVCTFLSIAVTNMLAICFKQNKVPASARCHCC